MYVHSAGIGVNVRTYQESGASVALGEWGSGVAKFEVVAMGFARRPTLWRMQVLVPLEVRSKLRSGIGSQHSCNV